MPKPMIPAGPASQFCNVKACAIAHIQNAVYIGWRTNRYTPPVTSECSARTASVTDQLRPSALCVA